MQTILDSATLRDPGRTARWGKSVIAALAAGVRRHLAIHVIALTVYVAAILQSLALGEPVELGLAGLFSGASLLIIAFLVCYRLFREVLGLMRSGYAGSPTAAAYAILLDRILTPGRIGNTVNAFVAFGLFSIGFVTLKANIPHIHPFGWDETFMRLDRIVHLGHLPDELLFPLLGHPAAIFALNVFYNLWFFVMMGFFMWQGIRETDTALRQRFIIAYLVCWALGTVVLGTIFSSAGPCFYGHVVPGPDPYAGLMAHLRQVNETYPIWALTAQDLLWESYTRGPGAIAGISAMPSMHVGTAVLFFLCARAAGIRWLPWCTGLFAAAIFLGSVMLGWHYAVDGYAGALIAIACWVAAGWWVKRGELSSRPS